MKKLFFSLLLFILILSGCDGNNESAQPSPSPSATATAKPNGSGLPGSTGHTVRSGDSALTVLDLKQKYGNRKQPDLMPLYNVNHNQIFEFPFNANLSELSFEELDQVVTVHTDPRALPESKIGSFSSIKDYNADKSILVVESIEAVLASSDSIRYQDDRSWGYAPIYYLRVNYDLDADTATKLTQPLIIPFTIKSRLAPPNVRSEIDAEGRLKLVWDKVRGAEKYNIYQATSSYNNKEAVKGPEQGYKSAYPYLIGTVTGTEFQDFASDGSGALHYNEFEKGSKELMNQNYLVSGHYFVSAVRGDEESNLGPPVDTIGLSASLPASMEDHSLFYKGYETVQELPATVSVTTINGTKLTRAVLYDPKLTAEKSEDGYTLVPFQVEGTRFKGKAHVWAVDPEELTALSEDNASLASTSKEGFIGTENTSSYVPEPDVPTLIGSGRKRVDAEDLINAQRKNTKKLIEEGNKEYVPAVSHLPPAALNADSALEEFLALHMAAADTRISLKAFPEAQNFSALSDTVDKVIYQNPYILDVDLYWYDYDSLMLHVEYDESRRKIRRKQKEILAEAGRVVDTIIKDGMTEDDKQKAIYDYLNAHTKYDDAAADNSEANAYKKVDPEFNDSFNAYGILVNKIGVCASYASAYKLLSDMAGLETIVVTGTLDHVPHAWNKVKTNKGWLNVDPTNNETNSGVPYMVYNSNDETAQDLHLTAGKEYWTDAQLGQFKGTDNSKDYYKTRGLEISSMKQFRSVLKLFIQRGDRQLVVRFEEQLEEDAIVEEVYDVYSRIAEDKLEDATYFLMDSYLVITH